MTIFLTGTTGYLGSYVVERLLAERSERLTVLVRAKSREEAEEKLWRALQLHMDAERFFESLGRIDVVRGDITEPGLGLSLDDRRMLHREVSSILHIAASLNRKSEKACLNTNLRGSLGVIKLAREIADRKGLARFSHVSTVAVAGERDREVVREDEAIEWDRSDYDPYARTKKFCEHMARELLADVPLTFFRPSIVMGDSRFPETTQFDMVRALCILADLPVVPVRGDARLDIVNADFVGTAIARLHTKERTDHGIYHLSAGVASKTADEISKAIFADGGRPPRYAPGLEATFANVVDVLARSKRRNVATLVGSLLKVFLPYITYDTVFDNTRVTTELGLTPTPFTAYCAPLYRYAKRVNYAYPHRPMPPRPLRVAMSGAGMREDAR